MALATKTTSPASMDMLVSALMSQGRESAAVLEALLHGASSPAHGGLQELAAEILRCCDRALAALHSGGEDATVTGSARSGAGRKRKSAPTSQTRPKRARASGGELPTRVEKKRTVEDGFIWRKYGQKDIHNSKHPRFYFRCTYKHDSGCPARRQVQQSEDDPSLYVVAYFGEHTCYGMADDDDKVQPFIINFGSSATASSGSPWPSSDNDDVRTDSSRSSQAVCSPEEDGGKLRVKVTKVEPDSHTAVPAAEMSSSTDDLSCASPALDPLLGYLDDWDCFGDSLFDINFDEI